MILSAIKELNKDHNKPPLAATKPRERTRLGQRYDNVGYNTVKLRGGDKNYIVGTTVNQSSRGGGVCSARRIPANQSTGGHGGHSLNLNNIFNKIKLLAKNISFLLCVSIIGFRLLHYGACGERHME